MSLTLGSHLCCTQPDRRTIRHGQRRHARPYLEVRCHNTTSLIRISFVGLSTARSAITFQVQHESSRDQTLSSFQRCGGGGRGSPPYHPHAVFSMGLGRNLTSWLSSVIYILFWNALLTLHLAGSIDTAALKRRLSGRRFSVLIRSTCNFIMLFRRFPKRCD